MMRRASPEYILMVARPSIVSEPFGSTVRTVVPSVVSFLRITHQPAPSVAAAVIVCVMDAVIAISFAVSALPRIVFDDRDSYSITFGPPLPPELILAPRQLKNHPLVVVSVTRSGFETWLVVVGSVVVSSPAVASLRK